MIALLIGLAALVLAAWMAYDDFGWWSVLFPGLMLGVIGFFGATLFLSIWTFEAGRQDHRIEIHSLRNESGPTGSFFLGSGYIDSREYYYTFYKDARGGYVRWKIPSYAASLFLDSDAPYVTYQIIEYKCPWWLSFVTLKDNEETRKDIHVPAGTIVEKYEVR